MTDDHEVLVLRVVAVPPPLVGRRRRHRRVLAVSAVVVAVAGVTMSVLGAESPDRTETSDRTPPDRTHPVAPVGPSPAPAVGGAGGQTAAAPGPGHAAAGAVLEGLALRPDGGLGPFAWGTPRDNVLAAATGLLGDPDTLHAPVPTTVGCAGDPTWTTTQDASWGDIALTFAGPDADDLHLVGWQALARREAPRRFRITDGPVLDDPLASWRAAYGAAVEVHERRAGDGGQANITVHLAGGDVTIAGRAAASGHAVVARGGAVCAANR